MRSIRLLWRLFVLKFQPKKGRKFQALEGLKFQAKADDSNFNTPEASSAHSERLFSGGKIVLETKHNHLGDEI